MATQILLRVSADRIINLDQIIEVKRLEDGGVSLTTFAPSSTGGHTSLLLDGDEAKALWEYLIERADVTKAAPPRPKKRGGPLSH